MCILSFHKWIVEKTLFRETTSSLFSTSEENMISINYSVAPRPALRQRGVETHTEVVCVSTGSTFPSNRFIPAGPLDTVVELCDRLRNNRQTFSIQLKIEGAFHFSLSSGDIKAKDGEGCPGRGPSHERRKLRRLLEGQK